MVAKYEMIRNQLKEKIVTGDYLVGAKLPTESELMAQFSVSRFTVRRAIADLENDNYVYKVQGGGMFVDDWRSTPIATTSTKLVGMITTHIAHYIFPNIISGVDRAVSKQGYSLLVANTHNQPSRERQALLSMLDNNVAGLIVEPTQSATNQENMDLYERFAALNIPIVFINAIYPGLEHPVVKQNDEIAEEHMVDYLFKKGHRKILGVFQVDDLQGVRRMNGFIHAYQQRPDLALDSATIMYRSSDPINLVQKKVEKYLEANPEITAIVAYNDQLAIQIYDLVREMGLAIPEDISVIGFDDYLLSSYIQPPLTTMTHEKEHMGSDAAKLLLQAINGETVASLNYEPNFVARESVADRTE
ncbi:GntR family transcriptional regulator [Weissella diestrammenae]|uniref:GntR family transcriptional regulator n=1 Tax=Weissella diestrammenae TaxID=1162633 RepID=A0A7G9T479_9LACO|nr:GntR family transcriptional regulator [Weissella diestrammenae]MCM0583430.1 GntR family transcriptional regulator [Weissella diestrammenae]QNN74904.1 GntR family transcriptional regulator [Weissella diestrammenae]